MNIAGSCCGRLWLAVVVQHQHQLQFQHHGLVMAVAGSGCESFLSTVVGFRALVDCNRPEKTRIDHCRFSKPEQVGVDCKNHKENL